MRYQKEIFCVIYETESSDNKKIKWFKITDKSDDVIFALNQSEPNIVVKGFSDFYEAEKFLKGEMSFDDKFLFGIAEGQPIMCNKFYEK